MCGEAVETLTTWIPTDAEIITMTVIALKRLHGQKCSDSSHGTKNPNIRKSAKTTPNEKLTGPGTAGLIMPKHCLTFSVEAINGNHI